MENTSDSSTVDSLDTFSEQDGDVGSQDDRQSVCAVLVAAREASGFTQQEIADRLFLNCNFIRYMDSGTFEKFPKPAFVRGYLRSYAREIGLSADAIIAVYNEEVERTSIPHETPLQDVTSQKVGSAHFTGSVERTGIISAIVIVVLLAGIWLVNPDDEPMTVSVGPAISGGSTLESSMGDDSDDADFRADGDNRMQNWPGSDQAASSASAEVPRTGVAVSKAGIRTTGEGLASATNDEQVVLDTSDNPLINTSRASDGDKQNILVNSGGSDHLRFVFVDDCWLEVVDGNDVPIYGDLNHNLDVLDIYGDGPFKLLIGRVSAVSARYNDKDVDLKAHAFNDTAKLVVE